MECRKCKTELPEEARFCMKCGVEQEVRRTAKRRDNGQGCAFKRGSTWTATYTEETYVADGKLHQRRRWKGGFPSKTAALAFAANPPPEKPAAPTLRSYWESWKSSDMLDLSKSKQSAFSITWGKLGSIAGRPIEELTIAELHPDTAATHAAVNTLGKGKDASPEGC